MIGAERLDARRSLRRVGQCGVVGVGEIGGEVLRHQVVLVDPLSRDRPIGCGDHAQRAALEADQYPAHIFDGVIRHLAVEQIGLLTHYGHRLPQEVA